MKDMASRRLLGSRGCTRFAGFTLLELLVVMVILGMLAAFVGPRYFGQLNKSEVRATQAQMTSIAKALDLYQLDIGHYPTTAQGLEALMARPEGETRWNGPYLNGELPRDAWGSAFVYRSPGETHEFDLVSLGADKQPGGEGLAHDLVVGPK